MIATLALAATMFSPAQIDAHVASLQNPPVFRGLNEHAFRRVLETKPDVVQFQNVEQATIYYNVLKGDGIANTFYSSMALASTHVGDLITTKVNLDAPDAEFVETNFLFKDVEGLILLKTAATISAAVMAGVRNRPSIVYHDSGGATVEKGSGSWWGTAIGLAINVAAIINNLVVRK